MITVTPPPRLSELARECAAAIDAYAAAQDDVKIDPMRASLDRVLTAAQLHAAGRLEVFAGMLYERHQIQRGDEVNRYRVCIGNGVVAGAWTLRVAAIAAEVGDG